MSKKTRIYRGDILNSHSKVLRAALFFLLMVLVMPIMVQAFEWDNKKSYDSKDRSITVTNSFLQLIDLDAIAKVTPRTPHVNYVIRGKDVLVAEFTIESYLTYKEKVWDGMKFYNKNSRDAEVIRDYKIRYKDVEAYDYPNYVEECKDTKEINETDGLPLWDCKYTYAPITRLRPVWRDLDTNADLPKGTLEIGIFADVYPDEFIEFVPTWFGVSMPEYSSWQDAYNIDLSVYYDFNSSSNMIDGTRQNLTANEGSLTFNDSSCLIGKCLQTYTGSNAKIQANSITNWKGDFTMNFWVRGVNDQANPFFLGSANAVLSSVGWNSPTQIYFADSWFGTTVSTAYNIGGDKWFMITLTRDNDLNGGTVSVYVNGTLVGSGTKSKVNNTQDDIKIGNHPNNAFDWHGQIDELGYWTRLLDAADIVSLYNSGAGLTYSETLPSVFTLSVNLTSYPNNTNFTTRPTLSFNSSGLASYGNLTNATLKVWFTNSTIYKTNFSAITGMPESSYQNLTLAIDADGKFKWNVEYCAINDTNDAKCTMATYNNTFSVDTLFPLINITYPKNASYNMIINATNFTAFDSVELSVCKFDNMTLNQTTSCSLNVTGNNSVEGNNKWIIWVNDTVGNTNFSSVEFFVDSIFPLINFTAPTPNDGANTSNPNFTVRVSLTEANPSNITFYLYNSTRNLINTSNLNFSEVIFNSSGDGDASDVLATNNQMAQTFRIGNDGSLNKSLYIEKVNLYLSANPAAANLTVALTGVNSSGQPNISQVYSMGFLDTKYVPAYATYGWSEVSMSEYLIEKGKMYALIINLTQAGGSLYWKLNVTTSLSEGYYWYVNNLNDYNSSANNSYRLIFNITTKGETMKYYNLTTGTYYYNVTATDIVNHKNSTETRSISIDTELPAVFVYEPKTMGLVYPNQNVSINFSVIDNVGNLEGCWYNYNGTNFTIPCATNNTMLLNKPNFLTFFANHTAGGYNSTTHYWNYTAFISNYSFVGLTYAGFSSPFSINFSLNSSAFSGINIKLSYNGTNYTMTSTDAGDDKRYTYTLSVPTTTTEINRTFFYTFELTNDSGVTVLETKQFNQTIKSFLIDNCSTNINPIMNMRMLDEETLLAINGTIEVNVHLYSQSTNELVNSYNDTFNYDNNFSAWSTICTSNFTGAFKMAYTIRHYGNQSIYFKKFRVAQNQTISNQTMPVNITLYNLLLSSGYSFVIKAREASQTTNLLIEAYKQYVGLDNYSLVESQLTDVDGNAILHLTPSSVNYRFIVSYEGQVISIQDSQQMICNNLATLDCQATLNLGQAATGVPNYNQLGSIAGSYNYNSTSKLLTFTFISTDGNSHVVNSHVILNDVYGNTTICNGTYTGTAGIITCPIPEVYLNSTAYANLLVDGNQTATTFFSTMPENNMYGADIVLELMMFSSLVLLFIAHPILIVIGALLGVFFSITLIFITSGSWTSIIFSLVFYVVAGVIILWQIGRRL